PLAVAPQIARQLVRRGAPRGRVILFPNPLDLGRFPIVTAAERRAARAKLGIDEHAAVALHFGWDWRRKGGDLFLDAVARLVGERRTHLLALTVGDRSAADRQAAK